MKTRIQDLTPKDIIQGKRLRHRTHDDKCWCRPEVLQNCPECEDTPNSNCWQCQGRSLVEAFDHDEPAIIVHRDL